MPCCAAVNPYITPAMQRGRWSLPRQPGALPLTSGRGAASSPAISGVSSFAFQGTNAHVLLSEAPQGSGVSQPVAGTWQRASFWLLAPQFDLVQAVQAGSQLAVFAAGLQAPAAAGLLQAVTVSGNSILTAGTAIELAAEAAAQLASASGLVADGSTRLLSGLVVSNAVVPAGQQSSPGTLQVAVSPAGGSFELLLLSAGSLHKRRASTVCASGQLGSSGCTVSTAALASSQQGISRAAAAIVQAGLKQLAPVAATSTARISSDPHSLLQAVAVGPAAIDASLQLPPAGCLATAAEAVLLSSAAAGGAGPKHAAAAGQSVRLGTVEGGAGACLSGIYRGSLPASSVHTKAAAGAAEQPEAQPKGMLYSIVWEAAGAAEAPGAHTLPAVAARQSASAAEAVAAAQAALNHVGGSLTADLHGSLLPMDGPGPAGTPRDAAAALHGVLKVLAQEAPTLAVAVHSHSSSDCSAGAQAAAAWSMALGAGSLPAGGTADLHGMASTSGASFLPRLVPQSSPASPSGFAEAHDSTTQGCFAVTGGSGVLGGYVAQWLLQQGAPAVLLLSRSGTIPGTVLAASSGATDCPTGLLSSSKADAALSGDVAGLVAAGAGSAALRGIMHAGGVLADATLANQTLAAIRQVRRRTILLDLLLAASTSYIDIVHRVPELELTLICCAPCLCGCVPIPCRVCRLLRPSRQPWRVCSSSQLCYR